MNFFLYSPGCRFISGIVEHHISSLRRHFQSNRTTNASAGTCNQTSLSFRHLPSFLSITPCTFKG